VDSYSYSDTALELLSALREYDFKSCGGSWISDWKKCLKGEAPHIAAHVAEGMAAWKAGKVVGAIAGQYMESAFGIDRELATKLSETFVQGTVATAIALGKRELKDPKSAVRKALTEYSAAFLGKTAHGAAENALSSREMAELIKTAGPVLAGKFTGIGTAIVGSKLPSVAQAAEMIAKRSAEDTAKIAAFFRSPAVNFAEEPEVDREAVEGLVDVFMIATMLSIKAN
jgi:hypothetical protein